MISEKEKIIGLGTWFDRNGLRACKIDTCFTIFKLAMVYGLMSVPFMFRLKKVSYDLDIDMIYSPSLGWLYGYLSLTYLIMSCAITHNYFQKMWNIMKAKTVFENNRLDIEDTNNALLDDILDKCGIDKDKFHKIALQRDNFIIGLDDTDCLRTKLPFFKNLLTTLPFEIVVKETIASYYLKPLDFSQTGGNSDNFKIYSKRIGLISIPFLPVIFIFTLANHVLTYSNNGHSLSIYSYNRYGRWKLRLYNEFESRLKTRLQRTHSAAEAVVSNSFCNSWRSSGYKFLSFICGSLTTIGIYMAFRGYERFYGMDIIPITGVLATISAVTYPRIKTHSHGIEYLKRNLKDDMTVSELKSFFSSKITILIYELISILLIPILLYFLLPMNSYFISNFFTNYARDSEYCVIAMIKSKKSERSSRHASMRMGESELFTV